MSLSRTLRSAFMRRMADPQRRERLRTRAEARRLREQRPHQVYYFHQVDDPYSQLAAQVLPRLLQRYAIELLPRVVAAPTPIAIHEQALWEAWARRECAAMAPFYGLDYADQDRQPDAALTDAVRRMLLRLQGAPEFAEVAVAAGGALHRGEEERLRVLLRRHGEEPSHSAAQHLERNFRLRHKLGHYLGAMFYYEGEWYWGIDRLHHLEARLDALGARRQGAPADASAVLTPRAPQRIESARRITLEFFPSLRSPYTHLSYERVRDLAARYPVDLVLRPVLPMMMRGVKADRRKGVYILQDTLREGERLGIAFGNIWDPFGPPVLRAYSLFPWARERGRGFEYLHEYSRAVWSERVDAWSHAGLRLIVERAGLSWDEALQRLDNREWEEEFERNVQEMIGAGSWGVPTLRIPAGESGPEFTVWGQDRIWLMEEELARRLGR